MQYTIRNVPQHLDAALRTAARQQGKSLNEVAVETLARGAGIRHTPHSRRDLSDVVSTWREDTAFLSAVVAQDTVDEAMWPPKRGRGPRARQSRSRAGRAA